MQSITSDSLPARIIALIKQGDTTYDTIITRGAAQGITAYEIDIALTRVHKDARIKTDGIHYSYREPTVAQPLAHLEWVKTHYPYPGENGIPPFEMPFPEWRIDHLFMTPEEALEYRACQKGNPNQKYKRKSYDTSKNKMSSHGETITSPSMTSGLTPVTVAIGH